MYGSDGPGGGSGGPGGGSGGPGGGSGVGGGAYKGWGRLFGLKADRFQREHMAVGAPFGL